ncbi:R-LORF1 protein [Gallid alphaherpesvirus 3]|uniref:R-LORF1 protein n=1 Tax=Gallid alphaherpesvirus 3 TaxID=35250 RepID=Q9DGW8_9ALPH|nr:R-LORF1 protein [Gallid alphaherpesvirus 3]BAB16579.1 R-LORF1 protein [Gallid alphaherpesvirus 3]
MCAHALAREPDGRTDGRTRLVAAFHGRFYSYWPTASARVGARSARVRDEAAVSRRRRKGCGPRFPSVLRPRHCCTAAGKRKTSCTHFPSAGTEAVSASPPRNSKKPVWRTRPWNLRGGGGLRGGCGAVVAGCSQDTEIKRVRTCRTIAYAEVLAREVNSGPRLTFPAGVRCSRRKL